MTARETHLVELVDAGGRPIGSATVEAAHQAPGRLHRAFSVFLRDGEGRVLLQQRAAAKTRFPLRWGNTCCGHPAPGQDVLSAADIRLGEELGVSGLPLREVGVYTYVATDPVTGRVEHEYDHVLLGDLPAGVELRPDPAEVAELHWVSVPELQEQLAATPDTYAPWLAGVTAELAASLATAARSDADASRSGSAAEPALDTLTERSGGR